MKTKTLRKALAVGVLAITSGYAVQASAIPSFTFTEYGGFAKDMVGVATYSGAVAQSPLGPDNPPVPLANLPVQDTMSWGTPVGSGPSSSMHLWTQTTSTALPIGPWTTISTLTHNNFVITEAISWGPQDVWGRFQITDSDGGAVLRLDNTDPVILNFTETANEEPCDPNHIGSLCNDHFTYNAASLDPLDFFANDGSQWRVYFQLANFTNAYHDEPNATVYTAEETSSHVDVQARVEQIPEPATLALFGLGLLGLGFAKRRGLNG